MLLPRHSGGGALEDTATQTDLDIAPLRRPRTNAHGLYAVQAT